MIDNLIFFEYKLARDEYNKDGNKAPIHINHDFWKGTDIQIPLSPLGHSFFFFFLMIFMFLLLVFPNLLFAVTTIFKLLKYSQVKS